MITTLFHAASTTTRSSHPRGQHDQSSRLATGDKEGEGGGMITTLFHAASTTTSSHPRGQHDQAPASQRVRGKGGKAGAGA